MISLLRSMRIVFWVQLLIVGSLWSSEAPVPNVPSPDIEIDIPMRDGAKLPANMYFPNHKKGAYSCILVRNPIGKENFDPSWLSLLENDYMIVIQSTRSSIDQTGKQLPYITEDRDGYDTVEWLAASEFTNGQIATLGLSATGITQLFLAPTQPPHLKCQYIEVAAPSLYQYAVWPGHVFRKEQVEGWLYVHKRDPAIITWLHAQTEYDEFWKRFDNLRKAKDVKIPQVHIGGWYDIFIQGTIDTFRAAQSESPSAANQRLIIGPWAHRWKRSPNFGDFPALEQGKQPPHPITMKDWFDYFVKNKETGISEIPLVQYYVMGPLDGTKSLGNVWRSATEWPPQARVDTYYLKDGNGLTTVAQEQGAFCAVSFDPENPVPTVGGRNLFLPDGPKDLTTIEQRKDVVCFTTEPLAEDLEVTGRVMGEIYLTDVAVNRDICCRISDVYPDGKSIIIAEGVSHVTPGATSEMIQKVDVDFWSTSMVFAKGHKIRLSVSASNFPAYETSLIANPDASPTCFSLHLGGSQASHLSLPIIQHCMR